MTTATPPDVAQAETEATTAEQLATAQQAGVFARLRAEAARRKATRAATRAAEQHRTYRDHRETYDRLMHGGGEAA
ncbi:hypothetical protein [Streptomyces anthocyanicus]|uniref:hypothetical protein n=1 Tax=Streptomyces anthocyanicus TaxID=68174 RepID=UPI0036354A7E